MAKKCPDSEETVFSPFRLEPPFSRLEPPFLQEFLVKWAPLFSGSCIWKISGPRLPLCPLRDCPGYIAGTGPNRPTKQAGDIPMGREYFLDPPPLWNTTDTLLALLHHCTESCLGRVVNNTFEGFFFLNEKRDFQFTKQTVEFCRETRVLEKLVEFPRGVFHIFPNAYPCYTLTLLKALENSGEKRDNFILVSMQLTSIFCCFPHGEPTTLAYCRHFNIRLTLSSFCC